MTKVKQYTIPLENDKRPDVVSFFPIELEGTARVYIDQRSEQYQDALAWYRHEVNREADAQDLAGYIATAVIEYGPEVNGVGHVDVRSTKDPAPETWPPFVVVYPKFNLYTLPAQRHPTPIR
jgi:hypothetical protein